MTPHRIRAEAAKELAEAAAWYEREAAPGMGAALLEAYEVRLESALQSPGAGALVATTADGTPVRRYRLKRFRRYAILMAELSGIPTVLAFECSSRRPGFWQDRLK